MQNLNSFSIKSIFFMTLFFNSLTRPCQEPLRAATTNQLNACLSVLTKLPASKKDFVNANPLPTSPRRKIIFSESRRHTVSLIDPHTKEVFSSPDDHNFKCLQQESKENGDAKKEYYTIAYAYYLQRFSQRNDLPVQRPT